MRLTSIILFSFLNCIVGSHATLADSKACPPAPGPYMAHCTGVMTYPKGKHCYLFAICATDNKEKWHRTTLEDYDKYPASAINNCDGRLQIGCCGMLCYPTDPSYCGYTTDYVCNPATYCCEHTGKSTQQTKKKFK